MYIRHQPLFSFETLQEYQPKTRLTLLFETLDLHPCLKELPAKSIRGPKGYCGYALLRALLAKQLFQIPTFTLLVERLAQANPMGRLGTPEDIANVVSFLAGPDGAWVNGQTLRANGGMV